MAKHFSDADCMALVARSPAAVAVHDKAAWLDLFARDYRVEDPVGSPAHVCADEMVDQSTDDVLGPFYDTFIAPYAISFHGDRDGVRGLHVMRDVTIEISMSPRVTVHVPVHLLYELIDQSGELKIRRLAAHWELRPMLKQQMSAGWPFFIVGFASASRMLRHLGVAGLLGFMRALSSVGDAGKARIGHFVRCYNSGDEHGLRALFARPDIEIAFCDEGPALCIKRLAAQGGELRLTKVLAAGDTVTATLEWRDNRAVRRGVALFTLDRSALAITDLTVYWDRTRQA